MPPRKQHVVLLLAKAAQDEYVLDKLLDDPDAPLEVFGFHAQQTAEKLLKAILSHAGVTYPRTHQLVELLDLAADHGLELPAAAEELRHLTPFAVDFRYDVLPGEDQPVLDKKAVRRDLARLRTWVESRIQGKVAEAPAKYTAKRKR
ncbi:MAG: HEPN domain-containing protein [Verrucomicrobiota bacterium]